MSTTNLKQGARNCAQLQGSNTTGRRHRHTQGKQNGLSLPIFVSIDTGNAERESNQRSTRMGLNEGTEFTDTLQTRRVPRAHDKGRRLERTTKKPHSATSNKSPQQRSLLRTRAWLKIYLLGASAHTIQMRCIYECRTQRDDGHDQGATRETNKPDLASTHTNKTRQTSSQTNYAQALRRARSSANGPAKTRKHVHLL